MTRPADLPEHEGSHLDDLLAGACPHLTILTEHIRAFADLLTTRRGNNLEDWMSAVEASDLPTLHSFVRGLRKDLPAVIAGLSLPYSNGPAGAQHQGQGARRLDRGTELVHAATRSAAAIAAPFAKGPRTRQPVAARHLSLTRPRPPHPDRHRPGRRRRHRLAARPPTRAAAHPPQRALAVIATARVTTDPAPPPRPQITRQPFPHAPRGITTRTGPAHPHICGTAA